MNDPTQLLSLFLNGAMGRSGRKRARRAASFISGKRGFLSASTILAAAGVAWGIYDSLKSQGAQGAQGTLGAQGALGATGVPSSSAAAVPPLPVPATSTAVPPEVLRIVRLAVSAARADGVLAPEERAAILARARQAGVEADVEAEIDRPHPLADIVRGVTDEQARKDLYVLAFAIVRADETVSGGERIYLAQLAHQLGLDQAAVRDLEAATSAGIDAAAGA